MDKTFLLATLITGKSAQDTVLSQGDGFIHFYHFFFKSVISDLVLCIIYRMRRQSTGRGIASKVLSSRTQHISGIESKRICDVTLNVQNMSPGKCRIRCCSWHQLPASQEVPAWASYHLGLHQAGRVEYLCYSSDARTRRALLSPLTLCRVQGGCTSEVHSPSSRWCKQTVLGLMCPADRTARCATSLMGHPTRGARQDQLPFQMCVAESYGRMLKLKLVLAVCTVNQQGKV